MSILISWLLIAAAILLFLTGVVAALRGGSAASPRPATCVMLVLLRLAIGWHFFVEGMDKLHTPTWSSAGYLREATGPLGPRFQALAGDPIVDMLTPRSDDTLSEALDQEWQNYVDAVDRFYGLPEATNNVQGFVDFLKKQTAHKLKTQKKKVERISPYPPPLKVELTIEERIKILEELQKKVADIEAGPLPHTTTEAFEEWKTARANVNRWRGDLQKDLALVNRSLKRTVVDALLRELLAHMPEGVSSLELSDFIGRQRELTDTEIDGGLAKVFSKVSLKPGRTYVIDMTSPNFKFDCYLRLEDASGIVLDQSLGSGANRVGSSARLTFKVGANNRPLRKAPDPKIAVPDSFRIVAGSFGKQVGEFSIICMEDDGSKRSGFERWKAKEALGAVTMITQPDPLAMLAPWLAASFNVGESFKVGEPFTTTLSADDKDSARLAAEPADWEAIDRIHDKFTEKLVDEFRKKLSGHDLSRDKYAQMVFDNILSKKKKDQPSLDPLPFPVTRPWRQWTLLDWSDHVVKYGILTVGAMLLLGLFTRLACVAGAGFLLTFFLAMPPLPGWPESPRAEGHYLYVNKNIIEMLALLVLATTMSGRWCGLDGLVQFLNPWRWRRRPEAVRIIKGTVAGVPGH